MDITPKTNVHPSGVPTRRYPQYKICAADTYYELEQKVNEAIRDGYIMHGSLVDNPDNPAVQAMIKWVQ